MYLTGNSPIARSFDANSAARSLLSAQTRLLLTIYSAAADGLALYMQLIHDAAKTTGDIL